MLRPVDGERWEALVRPGRRCRVGRAGERGGRGGARATVRGAGSDGARVVEIEAPVAGARAARAPRPAAPAARTSRGTTRPSPRIASATRRSTRAHDGLGGRAHRRASLHAGAARAPRARSGVEIHCLTLHVGPGTFRPLRADARRGAPDRGRERRDPRGDGRGGQPRPGRGPPRRRRRHHHHAGARVGGRRRTAGVRAGRGAADLFIYPGHRFRVVDALVTNFHLPALDAAAPRLRLLRARGAARAPTATPSPRAIASTRTATRC